MEEESNEEIIKTIKTPCINDDVQLSVGIQGSQADRCGLEPEPVHEPVNVEDINDEQKYFQVFQKYKKELGELKFKANNDLPEKYFNQLF